MIDTDDLDNMSRRDLVASHIILNQVHFILSEENKALAEAVKGDNEILKKHIETLAEVERLREENETLRKMDWEYECLWTWLDENTNLLNTIEPLMVEWSKEAIE